MGENIFKWCDQKGINFQNIWIADTAQYPNKQPAPKKLTKDINRHFSKKDISQSVQLLSCVRIFVTPWTAAHQASLSITNSRSLLKRMSIESVMHPTISSSVVPFSRLQSFPASGSSPVSQFFAPGGQSIGVLCRWLTTPCRGADARM